MLWPVSIASDLCLDAGGYSFFFFFENAAANSFKIFGTILAPIGGAKG